MEPMRPRPSTASRAGVDIDLLGPLRIRHRGVEPVVTGDRARSLVACLAVRATPTPAEVLIADLWPRQAPRNPKHALENHVSRLRGALRAIGASEIVVHRGAGYALAGVRTDVALFQSLVGQGQRAARCEDLEPASSMFRQAEGLWRGVPFDGLPPSEVLAAQVARLEEQRRRVRDLLFDVELALGRDADLVPELRADVHDDPLNERRRGQLMIALYRAGRPAAAVQVYQEGVELLRCEMGLDPSPELHRLHLSVLRQELPQRPAADSAPQRSSASQRPTCSTHRRAVTVHPWRERSAVGERMRGGESAVRARASRATGPMWPRVESRTGRRWA